MGWVVTDRANIMVFLAMMTAVCLFMGYGDLALIFGLTTGFSAFLVLYAILTRDFM